MKINGSITIVLNIIDIVLIIYCVTLVIFRNHGNIPFIIAILCCQRNVIFTRVHQLLKLSRSTFAFILSVDVTQTKAL